MNGSRILRLAAAAVWLFPVQAVGAPETEDPKPAASKPAESKPAAAGQEASEPAPLIDEQGLPYREVRIEKRPGTFLREGENRVRIFGGYVFEILSEDDKEFVVKQILPGKEGPAPPPARPPALDLEEIAKRYEVTLPASDRLRLEPFDRGLPRAGQWRNGFDVVDLDRDGRHEILFGPPRKGRARPHIFRHDGAGNWTHDAEPRFPAQRYDYGDAKSADLNGDGRSDLAFGMHLLGMTALVDDGAGKYLPWNRGIELAEPGAAGGAFSSRAFVLADWNGDRRIDLIALGDGPSAPAAMQPAPGSQRPAGAAMGLVVYKNRGDGSWERWTDPSPAAQRLFGDALAVGDLDRDGDLDLVVGARQTGRKSLLGYQQADGSVTWAPLEALRPKALVDAVSIADLDRDGWLDLAIGCRNLEGVWRSGIDLFFGGPEGFVRRPLLAVEGNDPVAALAVGDLDADGDADVAAFPHEGAAWIFLATGKREFARETTVAGELGAGAAGCHGFAARIVDLDGDRRGEIVAAFAGEPDSRDLFGNVQPEGCTQGGSIRVFRAAEAGS